MKLVPPHAVNGHEVPVVGLQVLRVVGCSTRYSSVCPLLARLPAPCLQAMSIHLASSFLLAPLPHGHPSFPHSLASASSIWPSRATQDSPLLHLWMRPSSVPTRKRCSVWLLKSMQQPPARPTSDVSSCMPPNYSSAAAESRPRSPPTRAPATRPNNSSSQAASPRRIGPPSTPGQASTVLAHASVPTIVKGPQKIHPLRQCRLSSAIFHDAPAPPDQQIQGQ